MADTVDRSRPPAMGPAPAPRLPALSRAPVEHGLEIVTLRAAGPPIVVLEAIVPAGSAHDPPGEAGRADLTASLLPEGAAGLGMLEIAGRLAALGAQFSVGTNHDAAWLRLVVLESNSEAALDLLADLILRPSFPAAEVERILAEREVDLQRERDDPSVVASRTFAAELYGPEHPYGQPTRGTLKSVRGLARDVLVAFFHRAWRPRGATLLAVGDLDAGALRSRVETAFGEWTPGASPVVDVAPPDEPGAGVVLVDRPASAQSVIRCGHIGVGRAHPDYHALEALNHLLGGAFTSRLNLNLRERRGWTYGVHSSFSFRRGPGPFAVSAQVATPVTRPALEEIHGEIDRATAGPIEERERTLAVHGLTRSLPLRFETPSLIADRVREIVVYDLPDDYWADYAERIRALPVEELERVAADHLHPDRLLSVVVGDGETVEDELAELGPLRHRPWKPTPPSPVSPPRRATGSLWTPPGVDA